MSQLTHVLNITKQMEQLLDEKNTVKTRESLITEINDLVEKRGQLLQQIIPPFTDEEQQMGKEVIVLNSSIQTKMNDIFTELKQEMKQLNKQKKSSQMYVNPYGPMQTIDGMFLDQKQ